MAEAARVARRSLVARAGSSKRAWATSFGVPVEVCSRLIVPRLKAEGYPGNYREFEGKHTLPPKVAEEAMKWLMEMPAA